MTVSVLIADLLQAGMILKADGNDLRFRGPKGLLSPARKEELATHKTDLLAFLGDQNLYGVPSFAQTRLWFLQQLNPTTAAYNMATAVRMSGELDVGMLKASLNNTIQRHDILRTTFPVIEGRPFQCVASELDLEIHFMPVSDSANLDEMLTQAIRRPFSLAEGPLLRPVLFQLKATEHVFLVVAHHIISDAWSTGILIHEIAASYTAIQHNQTPDLPSLPIQYADFAQLQHYHLQGDSVKTQLKYWQEQVGPNPEPLALPIDHPRPHTPTYQGQTLNCLLPYALSQNLLAFGAQEGCTLFMTLLAAFQALLQRYTGQTRIMVGSPVANRHQADVENLLGLFVNTLLFYTDFSGHPTFRHLLARVREVTLGAYANQDIPFEKLVDELQPTRDLSRQPLFQVLFALHNEPLKNQQLPGVILTEVPLENEVARFDLSLDLVQLETGIAGRWEFNSDLFDTETIQRLSDHFIAFTAALLASPDTPLTQLTYLAEGEQQQLLQDWNQTEKAYTPTPIHQLFAQYAALVPDKTAVICQEKSLSYAELNAQANQLAHYLQSHGVGPEVRVGVCLERSLQMVITLLGILKAGGAYVPLDPTYPPERLHLVIADADMALLITQSSLRTILPAQPMEILCIDEAVEHWHSQPTTNLPDRLRADHLAYVIYTSGSTGRPKGVQIPHQALSNFLQSVQQLPGFSAYDTLLAVTTLSFDIAGLELFLPLISGGTVHVASAAEVKDGQELLAHLLDADITVMQATPATWQLLLEAGWQGQKPLRALCGGEALPRDLALALCDTGCELWNMYGPTETTIWSAANPLTTVFESVPIGNPLANTQLYVLDAHMQPVPVGVWGELYIGGEGLARGYNQQAGLTASRFLPHPFTPQAGARLFKTGDSVRYLANGMLEFSGRLDHQVKIRGFRIELGEIEVALSEHTAVHHCIVTAWEADGQRQPSKQLVAYLVGEKQTSVEELRSFLMAKLPGYMIPSYFIWLDAFPLLPNGKTNRTALPLPEVSRPLLSTDYAPPQSAREQQIADVWQAVLHLDRVGIYDNFFDLGGHSLLLAQIHNQLVQKMAVEITLLELFQYPTIQSLAHYLNDGSRNTVVNDALGEKMKVGKSRLQQQLARRRQVERR